MIACRPDKNVSLVQGRRKHSAVDLSACIAFEELTEITQEQLLVLYGSVIRKITFVIEEAQNGWTWNITLHSKGKASSERVIVEQNEVKKRIEEVEVGSKKKSKVHDAGNRFRGRRQTLKVPANDPRLLQESSNFPNSHTQR